MGTTPLWVPLVVAVIGLVATIVGTIVGVIITQRRSDRREKIAWERERWAREDAARTFELRRERLDPGNDLNSHYWLSASRFIRSTLRLTNGRGLTTSSCWHPRGDRALPAARQ